MSFKASPLAAALRGELRRLRGRVALGQGCSILRHLCGASTHTNCFRHLLQEREREAKDTRSLDSQEGKDCSSSALKRMQLCAPRVSTAGLGRQERVLGPQLTKMSAVRTQVSRPARCSGGSVRDREASGRRSS
jgi:hypothetical protein